jgi:ADP-heptose:LPS heptosyltransferase
VATRMRERDLIPRAPSVLVIETGLVGELLVITPALRAVRRAWPGSRVTAVVSPGSAPVLVGNTDVDVLLPLSKSERSGVFGLLRLSSWIRSRRFDVALVFHTSFRSALAAFLGGVPVRAGLASEGRGFLLTHKCPRDRSAYEVDEHLRVVGLLGVEPHGRELVLNLTDEEREEAASLLRGVGDGQLVCLHPGASREIRRWPAERFAELGARLAGVAGAVPIYAFGPREKELAQTVERWYAGSRLDRPVVVFPRTVRVLGALFERAAAVVTNNTGPMHVAAAMRAPGVFIHGPTPVDRWHPPGDRYVAVFGKNVACRPCDSPICAARSLLCMEAVSVERVVDEVAGLLDRGRNGRRSEGGALA